MFSRLATLAIFACSALYASAAITILAPSSTYWWIANSQNLYSWTCGSQYNGGYTNFTVSLNNPSNQALFPGPVGLIAIQWDYDCSILLPPVSSAGPGSGYVLTFSDVFNGTNIIATSEPFEIKPFGSAYAPQPAGISSAVTASASGAGASASSTAKAANGAITTHPKIIVGFASALMTMAGAFLLI